MKWSVPATSAVKRPAGPVMGILAPGDAHTLELFLQRHWSTSVTLRANLRAAGLDNMGQPHQGTYFAAWEGATIVGVAAHYNDDVVVLQAPRALQQIVRGVVAASNRAVAAIQGPWPQVEAAVAALGFARDKLTGKAQILSTLDLARMLTPDLIKRGQVKIREANPSDLKTLLPWHAAHQEGNTPFVDSSDATRAALQMRIDAQAMYIAETDRPVAMVCFDMWQGDAVKIGAIHTLPALKDKGFARAAIVGALQAAQQRGVTRAIILCDKTDTASQRAFGAIGFTTLSDYGVLRRPQ